MCQPVLQENLTQPSRKFSPGIVYGVLFFFFLKLYNKQIKVLMIPSQQMPDAIYSISIGCLAFSFFECRNFILGL